MSTHSENPHRRTQASRVEQEDIVLIFLPAIIYIHSVVESVKYYPSVKKRGCRSGGDKGCHKREKTKQNNTPAMSRPARALQERRVHRLVAPMQPHVVQVHRQRCMPALGTNVQAEIQPRNGKKSKTKKGNKCWFAPFPHRHSHKHLAWDRYPELDFRRLVTDKAKAHVTAFATVGGRRLLRQLKSLTDIDEEIIPKTTGVSSQEGRHHVPLTLL